VSDQVHIEDLKKQNEDLAMDETVEVDELKPDSLELHELLKQRIERVKKAFRPVGTLQHIRSLDNNKGK
jgi:hypothetical protein